MNECAVVLESSQICRTGWRSPARNGRIISSRPSALCRLWLYDGQKVWDPGIVLVTKPIKMMTT